MHAGPSNMSFRHMARNAADSSQGTADEGNNNNSDSKELTETFGKLRLQGKSKQIDKMKILEQMI